MADPFTRATLALSLLAIDPKGLGGMHIRARVGPVRTALAEMFGALPLPLTRLHPGVSDSALYGGLDLAATLAAGQLVLEQGLLLTPSALVMPMAERLTPDLAARLALVLDQGTGHCLIALDEGAEPDESLPASLAERLAFSVDLEPVAVGDLTGFPPEPEELIAARAALPCVAYPSDALAQIAGLCAQLGVDSGRAGLMALRAARANAALLGKDSIDFDDVTTACALVLAHRATVFPVADEEQVPPPPPPEQEGEAEAPDPDDDALHLPEELLLEAVRAMIPDDLLARLAAGKIKGARGSGTGAKKKGNRRGRPKPSRPGRLGDGQRIDIVATLRAAAPWQTVRGRDGPLKIRPDDIRVKRYEDKSDRLLIFAVDASGSAALARLAEAKGAVELLLAQAYARRDHVALIAFRGTEAEILLPPTRSLVQTKRRLAALPGGGGTPLAAGLKAALELAGQAGRRGLTPTLALLTDGRANIALDGAADRAQAAEDAQRIAAGMRVNGVEALVIDTGNRPERALRELAGTLGAVYLPLPRADAERLSKAVSAALD
nr:magnesium chelatase subunit D [Flavimaricola marinus]